MRLWLPQLLSVWLLSAVAFGETASPAPSVPAVIDTPANSAPRIAKVYVIPIREQIGSAVLYVVRRGVKEAIEQQAGAIVFDMKTPGGSLDKTFGIMEAIARFRGTTITYVNEEAMSAGAFISATTDEIWFAPDGIIGAAAPVSVGGQEIDATMRLKIVSYLKARVRSISEGKGSYRGRVVSAMIDADQELKIGDKVLKEKGELLSLTASEAAQTYGEPPQPLLSAGTAATLDELIARRFGPDTKVTALRLTWSEDLASWLNAVSPLLLGLGLLALFIEFKTPGFGIFGIAGIACLAVVFLGNFAAGLSGHEPMLVFGLGLLLVAVELFFFPGVFLLAIGGLVLMFGSLVWSMLDHWPSDAAPVAWNPDILVAPLANLTLGILIAIGLGVLLARVIPRGLFWDRLVLGTAVAATAQSENSGAATAANLVGARGVAVTALRPAGEIEIDGRRYEASVELGAVEAGAWVVVRRRGDFGLVVEREVS